MSRKGRGRLLGRSAGSGRITLEASVTASVTPFVIGVEARCRLLTGEVVRFRFRFNLICPAVHPLCGAQSIVVRRRCMHCRFSGGAPSPASYRRVFDRVLSPPSRSRWAVVIVLPSPRSNIGACSLRGVRLCRRLISLALSGLPPLGVPRLVPRAPSPPSAPTPPHPSPSLESVSLS